MAGWVGVEGVKGQLWKGDAPFFKADSLTGGQERLELCVVNCVCLHAQKVPMMWKTVSECDVHRACTSIAGLAS